MLNTITFLAIVYCCLLIAQDLKMPKPNQNAFPPIENLVFKNEILESCNQEYRYCIFQSCEFTGPKNKFVSCTFKGANYFHNSCYETEGCRFQ